MYTHGTFSYVTQGCTQFRLNSFAGSKIGYERYVTVVTGQGDHVIFEAVGSLLQNLVRQGLVAEYEADECQGAWRIWLLPPKPAPGFLKLLFLELVSRCQAVTPFHFPQLHTRAPG